MSFIWLAVALHLLVTVCYGSHFHGAITEWRVSETNDDETVVLKVISKTHFKSGCPYSVTFTCFEQLTADSIPSFYASITNCSESSTYDSWFTSLNIAYISTSVGSTCKMSFTSSAWISSLYNNPGSWSVPMFIDLRPRNDTNTINTSPVAVQQPLARFVVGCPDSVTIHLSDDDGDFVTCRYGNTFDETGSVDNSYPYFSSNPYSSATEECVISYNGGGSAAKVAVALIVEDHPRDIPTKVLSYNSLQFVIDVVSGHSCGSKPMFVPPTPPDGQSFTVLDGEHFNISLQAKPMTYNENIVEVNLIATSLNVTKSRIEYKGGNEYAATLSWTPSAQDERSNYICFVVRGSSGLLSEQRCVTVTVGAGASPCAVNNGGCSEICRESGATYVCECERNCWELGSDKRQCIPKMIRSCSSGRMELTVENCAFDGPIGIGDFDADNDSLIPPECRETVTNSHTEFDFALTECGTTQVESMNEVKYKNTVKMWIDSNSDQSVITRGQWYYVDYICSIEKYFNVSGTFDPEDTSTTIIVEEGFSVIDVNFDFYHDSTFHNAYSPYDYPLKVDVSENLYFGILATSDDSDVELYTQNCVARPEPDAGYQYEMIQNGCIMDETMQVYPSNNPMLNKFSIEAFRFRYGLPGITESTNVVIECRVVVCVSSVQGTTCDEVCVSNSQRSGISFVIARKAHLNKNRAQLPAEDDDDEAPVPTRDPNTKETKPSPVLKSGMFQIAQVQGASSPANPISTSSGQKVFSLNCFIFSIGLALCGLVVRLDTMY